MSEQVINVRDLDTQQWTEEMYVFCDDMFSDLAGIFGEETCCYFGRRAPASLFANSAGQRDCTQ